MNERTCACEELEGKMLNYSHNLQTFGEIAVVKDNGPKIKGKLKDRRMKIMVWRKSKTKVHLKRGQKSINFIQ